MYVLGCKPLDDRPEIESIFHKLLTFVSQLQNSRILCFIFFGFVRITLNFLQKNAIFTFCICKAYLRSTPLMMVRL